MTYVKDFKINKTKGNCGGVEMSYADAVAKCKEHQNIKGDTDYSNYEVVFVEGGVTPEMEDYWRNLTASKNLRPGQILKSRGKSAQGNTFAEIIPVGGSESEVFAASIPWKEGVKGRFVEYYIIEKDVIKPVYNQRNVALEGVALVCKETFARIPEQRSHSREDFKGILNMANDATDLAFGQLERNKLARAQRVVLALDKSEHTTDANPELVADLMKKAGIVFKEGVDISAALADVTV